MTKVIKDNGDKENFVAKEYIYSVRVIGMKVVGRMV